MIEIFTDGSCVPNPGRGGWSFVVFEGGHEVHRENGQINGVTTNNRAELLGVIEALEWLGGRAARVHTDSRYVTDGANSWCRVWARRGWQRKVKGKGLQPVVNVDLWQQLVAARRDCHSLHWVKGHAGHAGNERADRLAEAARMGVPA